MGAGKHFLFQAPVTLSAHVLGVICLSVLHWTSKHHYLALFLLYQNAHEVSSTLKHKFFWTTRVTTSSCSLWYSHPFIGHEEPLALGGVGHTLTSSWSRTLLSLWCWSSDFTFCLQRTPSLFGTILTLARGNLAFQSVHWPQYFHSGMASFLLNRSQPVINQVSSSFGFRSLPGPPQRLKSGPEMYPGTWGSQMQEADPCPALSCSWFHHCSLPTCWDMLLLCPWTSDYLSEALALGHSDLPCQCAVPLTASDGPVPLCPKVRVQTGSCCQN